MNGNDLDSNASPSAARLITLNKQPNYPTESSRRHSPLPSKFVCSIITADVAFVHLRDLKRRKKVQPSGMSSGEPFRNFLRNHLTSGREEIKSNKRRKFSLKLNYFFIDLFFLFILFLYHIYVEFFSFFLFFMFKLKKTFFLSHSAKI